jgi:hypothetical protein
MVSGAVAVVAEANRAGRHVTAGERRREDATAAERGPDVAAAWRAVP